MILNMTNAKKRKENKNKNKMKGKKKKPAARPVGRKKSNKSMA